MWAILEGYHDEGLRDGPRLSAYAGRLLAKARKVELPAGATPREHAIALVDKVDQRPGIDPAVSLQWLIDALVLWPDCAEAYMWVANIIEGREHAPILMQPFYILAIEGLRRRLAAGASAHQDAATEQALLVRALKGLGEALATTGLASEAVGRYIEALQLDPGDAEDIRPRLAIALMVTGETESAESALVPAAETPLQLFAKAAVSYAKTEGTGEARHALIAARRANPYVTPFLTGQKKMSGMLTGKAAVDEAQYICLALAPAVSGVPGFAAWLRREAAPPVVARGKAGKQHKKR
jgi:tetratricopeptide (TPR) repeat protein